MAAESPRGPWRAIWQIATSDGALVVLLLAIAAGLTVAAWLPQMPPDDPAAYARWLSKSQALFGTAAPGMEALGLFTVTRSFGFRALLGVLAGCLLLRLIEHADRLRLDREMGRPAGGWRALGDARLSDVMGALRRRRYRLLKERSLVQGDRWPWAELFPLVLDGGALLLLSGLLVTHLWGWRVEGLILQGGERVTLADTEEWVGLSNDIRSTTHSPGIVTFVEQHGPGVRVGAADRAGQPLWLQETARADRVHQLTVPLTEDRYFAIPGAGLIVRLAPQAGSAVEPHSPVLVEVYRSPPGRLAMATVMEGQTELTVDDVTLGLTGAPYARLTVTFNPGAWPTGAGLVVLAVGLLGSAAWPVRRFWLRQEAGDIEASGDLPPLLESGEEA